MNEPLWRPYFKFALVAAGYFAAAAIALTAVAINVAETSGPIGQASSGMYAFGDLLTFCAMFGVCSLVPTGLGLFFLRRHRLFWPIIAVLGLGITLAVAAVVLFVLSVTRA